MSSTSNTDAAGRVTRQGSPALSVGLLPAEVAARVARGDVNSVEETASRTLWLLGIAALEVAVNLARR